MGILDFFKSKPKNTANVAKERLRIIVAQERSSRGAPDYLPLLQRELLEVIRTLLLAASAARSVPNAAVRTTCRPCVANCLKSSRNT